jgi:hypothetical protein
VTERHGLIAKKSPPRLPADIQTHHRGELGKLEMEEAKVWRAMDANKENWQAQMAGTAQLHGGIHIRRAKLLDVSAHMMSG